jgi:hypothetical protein
MSCATSAAVVKKVIVAKSPAREPREMPQSPWPEVQPPDNRVPKPTRSPAMDKTQALVAIEGPMSWSKEPIAKVG